MPGADVIHDAWETVHQDPLMRTLERSGREIHYKSLYYGSTSSASSISYMFLRVPGGLVLLQYAIMFLSGPIHHSRLSLLFLAKVNFSQGMIIIFLNGFFIVYSYPSQATRRFYHPNFIYAIKIHFVLALAEKSPQIIIDFVGIDAYFLSYPSYGATFPSGLSGLRGLRGILPRGVLVVIIVGHH